MVTLSFPLWVVYVIMPFAVAVLGHLVAGRCNAPRNNAGSIFGFVLGLLLDAVLFATVAPVPLTWLVAVASAAAAAWFVYSLGACGIVH